ncbi:TonB-dependent receptor domain-containing protein [Amphiplicatus metriothermophilus]|nr:TonB-dependent receptor [Amphiplicatus metriothermophilus]MBB5519556.1 iron complex outermembrane receptor protein [Amphiplicatus metriothermophilus]
MLRNGIAALAIASACWGAAGGADAQPRSARTEAASFDIPAQPLGAALNQFAIQSGKDVLFSPDVTRAKTSRAVRGVYSPEDALAALLPDDTLVFRKSDDDTFLIEAAATSGTDAAWRGEDRIVVTAQRREQQITDVGISMAVFQAGEIEEKRIGDLYDIADATPSLDVVLGNGSNNPTITLRGVGTTNPWLNNNPSVAIYADDLYLPSSVLLTFPVFDLERIEVLKGPQIGLYGRNSTAGAANFISARPTDEFEGYADVSYGNYDAVDARAAISGPLNDQLRFRIAGLLQKGGGYIDRAGTEGTTAGFTRVPGVIPGVASVPAEEGFGDKDIAAIRASLSWTPGDGVEFLLIGHYGKDESEYIGSTNTNGDRLGVFAPPSDEPFVDYDDAHLFADAEQYGAVLQARVALGDRYELVSVTGYTELDRLYAIGDFVPTRIAEPTFDEKVSTFSQELRLSYNADRLYWLLGASYSMDDIDYRREMISYDFLLGTLGTAFDQDDRAYAAFGQAEFELAPKWSVSGSLRYTNERKEYAGGSFDIDPFGTSLITVAFPNLAGGGIFLEPTYDDEDLSGNATVNWKPVDDTLVYASVGRGFKSGGFDGSGITDESSLTPFGPEKLWAYETGVKTALSGGAFSLAASFFYYDYTDKQVLALVDLGAGFNEAIIQNAASSRIFGGDVQADWRPVDTLRFSVSATFLDSKVTKWVSADPAETAARIGNELPGTPEASVTGAVAHSLPLGAAWTLNTTVWATYADSVFRDIENSPNLKSDSYALLNGRLELTQTEGGLSVYLFAKNVLDEEYVTAVRSLVGMEGNFYGAPRTFGAGLRYAF